MSRMLECSIHLSQGTHLLQPHLFGPLTITANTATDTGTETYTNPFPHKVVDQPPKDIEYRNLHGNHKSNSDKPRTVYSVSIIGHPSGSSSLEVEESPLHSLLHVKNTPSDSSSKSIGEYSHS